MANGPWTPAETAEIERLWEDGATRGEMCQALDRTSNSVASKLHSLGLPMGDERPVATPCDAHLQHIASASPGYGFPVVTSPTIDTLNDRERAMPRRRFFHEAA